MNLCQCGCGALVEKRYKKGHGRRGKTNTPEHNQKIGLANSGRKHTRVGTTSEYKAVPDSFLQNQQVGRRLSEETKAKMSRIAKEKGFGKWMVGRKRSEESIKKGADKVKGHEVSSDTRKKISDANGGQNNGMFGKRHTEEAKTKIAEAAAAMWENPEIRAQLLEAFNAPEHIEMLRQRRANMVLPVKDTTIEVIVRGFLDALGVLYQQHKMIKDIEHRYQCDFYVEAHGLVIECDGDYWHQYPHGRDIDRARTFEMEQQGYKVLRLWEHSIRKMSCDDFRLVLEKVVR